MRPMTLKEFLPGYSRSKRPLNIILPSAKRLIANKIVCTALKNLGTTVGQESEVDQSFDNDLYIRNLAAKAKGKK